MSEQEGSKQKPSVAIIVAVIGALGLIIAAIVKIFPSIIESPMFSGMQATNASLTQQAGEGLPPIPIESYPMEIYAYSLDDDPSLGTYSARLNSIKLDGFGDMV